MTTPGVPAPNRRAPTPRRRRPYERTRRTIIIDGEGRVPPVCGGVCKWSAVSGDVAGVKSTIEKRRASSAVGAVATPLSSSLGSSLRDKNKRGRIRREYPRFRQYEAANSGTQECERVRKSKYSNNPEGVKIGKFKCLRIYKSKEKYKNSTIDI